MGWLFVVSCSDWFCDVFFCGSFCSVLGGQFFNKTSLVEELEFFFDWGMWLVFLIACGLGVFG